MKNERDGKKNETCKGTEQETGTLGPLRNLATHLLYHQHGSEVQEESPALIAAQTAPLSNILLVSPWVSDPRGSGLLPLILALRALAPVTCCGYACLPLTFQTL